MNYGIVYSFHVRGGRLVDTFCYKQLLYSLSTLRKYNTSTPVKVFISFSSNDVEMDYSTLNAIPNVEVVNFDNTYPKEKMNYMWVTEGHAEFLFHRWKNALKSLKEYKYDKILYLDTDTIFYKDVLSLFEKYDQGMVWARGDNTYQVMEYLNLTNAMNDGQVLLSKEVLNYESLFEDFILEFINTALLKCENNFNSTTMSRSVRWIILQYGVFMFFNHINHPVSYFDVLDVALHQELEGSENFPILRHYYTGNSDKYLPKEFV